MAEEPKKVSEQPVRPDEPETQPGLDAASQSLTHALRTSFRILALIIVVLIGLFFVKNFKAVQPHQKALVLRFGKADRSRVKAKGSHYIWPYPIDEFILVTVTPRTLRCNTFWPKVTEEQRKETAEGKKDIPDEIVRDAADGYLLTGDLNILESQWTITYKVQDTDDAIIKYYNAFGSCDGQDGSQHRLHERADLLVKVALESAIVRDTSRFEVFDAYVHKKPLLNERVRDTVRKTLADLDCGLEVVLVKWDEIRPPKSVKGAFDDVLSAQQAVGRLIEEAAEQRNKRLTEAAGNDGIKLGNAVAAWWRAKDQGNKAEMKKQEAVITGFLDEAGGEVSATLAEARAHKTKLVEEAKADSLKIEEYMKYGSPERVKIQVEVERIDALREALSKATEIFWLGSAGSNAESELEIILNRRPEVLSEMRKYVETR